MEISAVVRLWIARGSEKSMAKKRRHKLDRLKHTILQKIHWRNHSGHNQNDHRLYQWQFSDSLCVSACSILQLDVFLTHRWSVSVEWQSRVSIRRSLHPNGFGVFVSIAVAVDPGLFRSQSWCCYDWWLDLQIYSSDMQYTMMVNDGKSLSCTEKQKIVCVCVWRLTVSQMLL